MSSEYKLQSNQLEEEKQTNESSLQTMYRFENISKLCLQILSTSEQITHKAAIQELLRKVHNKKDPDPMLDTSKSERERKNKRNQKSFRRMQDGRKRGYKISMLE